MRKSEHSPLKLAAAITSCLLGVACVGVAFAREEAESNLRIIPPSELVTYDISGENVAFINLAWSRLQQKYERSSKLSDFNVKLTRFGAATVAVEFVQVRRMSQEFAVKYYSVTIEDGRVSVSPEGNQLVR